VKVVADTSSLDTSSPAAAAYLRSATFFDAQRHPRVSFESTRIEFTSRSGGVVTGKLSLLGITRMIGLTFQLLDDPPAAGARNAVPAGRIRVAGVVRRSDWGMSALVPAVSDDVLLQIEAELPN
jgi:polyisoprenoid-binding protein YceI